MPKTITVHHRQSIWDIAIQEAGTAQAALEIAELNDLRLGDALTAGQEILIPDVFVNRDDAVKEYYYRKQIKPATAYLRPAAYGIGIDELGVDFTIGG